MNRYICLNCLHQWDSFNDRAVLRCSECHRNQGIDYEKFRQAVDVTKDAIRKIMKSPPPHHPPLEVFGLIPEVLEPVIEIAREKFPNPNVPLHFVRELLRLAYQEIKEEISPGRRESCPL